MSLPAVLPPGDESYDFLWRGWVVVGRGSLWAKITDSADTGCIMLRLLCRWKKKSLRKIFII